MLCNLFMLLFRLLFPFQKLFLEIFHDAFIPFSLDPGQAWYFARPAIRGGGGYGSDRLCILICCLRNALRGARYKLGQFSYRSLALKLTQLWDRYTFKVQKHTIKIFFVPFRVNRYLFELKVNHFEKNTWYQHFSRKRTNRSRKCTKLLKIRRVNLINRLVG